MSDPASTNAAAPAHGHEDPMSHVPPPSLWPLVVTAGLTLMPFGVVSLLGTLKQSPIWGPLTNPTVGLVTLLLGSLIFVVCLMGWCHQNIKEKLISHDVVKQQKDLQSFILLFLTGELMAFGAVFGYFYHQAVYYEGFSPVHGMHFGGPMVAYATFILLFSSVTCEFAHHALQAHKMLMAKVLFLATIVLGAVFLSFQGLEWGELIQKGFYPVGGSLNGTEAAAFASCFYVGTGFHGLHVAIGLVMLFMVLMRLEFGHFKGQRHFSVVAASWYWHFVDIVWVLLFITVYVVG
ncbi:MAG TPA: heme-copper oxidase subunit III [Planctomycetota bacterium]|jgi:cytochrome c oxidase subunit 3|nr:heme-copper oxidase subunit III [Planctomycetota bacterium]